MALVVSRAPEQAGRRRARHQRDHGEGAPRPGHAQDAGGLAAGPGRHGGATRPRRRRRGTDHQHAVGQTDGSAAVVEPLGYGRNRRSCPSLEQRTPRHPGRRHPTGDPASAAAPPSRRTALIRSGLIVGVLIVVFGIILPRYIDYADVAAAFRDLTVQQILVMTALGIVAWVASGLIFSVVDRGPVVGPGDDVVAHPRRHRGERPVRAVEHGRPVGGRARLGDRQRRRDRGGRPVRRRQRAQPPRPAAHRHRRPRRERRPDGRPERRTRRGRSPSSAPSRSSGDRADHRDRPFGADRRRGSDGSASAPRTGSCSALGATGHPTSRARSIASGTSSAS